MNSDAPNPPAPARPVHVTFGKMRAAGLLFFVLLCGCGKERNQLESATRIIATPTADLEPSSIGFRLGGYGNTIYYPPPWEILFVNPRTKVGPTAYDSKGIPASIVVVLSDQQLPRLRQFVNDAGAFGTISRFTSIRSPDSAVPAPPYPPTQARLASRYDCVLELRATSYYRGAHHVDEFATIDRRSDAEAFLQKLEPYVPDENSRKGLLQFRENLRRGTPNQPSKSPR